MDRTKTKIWYGGLAEIRGHAAVTTPSASASAAVPRPAGLGAAGADTRTGSAKEKPVGQETVLRRFTGRWVGDKPVRDVAGGRGGEKTVLCRFKRGGPEPGATRAPATGQAIMLRHSTTGLSNLDTVVLPWPPRSRQPAGRRGRRFGSAPASLQGLEGLVRAVGTRLQGSRTALRASASLTVALAVLGLGNVAMRALSAPEGGAGETRGPKTLMEASQGTTQRPAPAFGAQRGQGRDAVPKTAVEAPHDKAVEAGVRSAVHRANRAAPIVRHGEKPAPDSGTTECAAVDALVAGDYRLAMARYRQLSHAHPSRPAFTEAYRILSDSFASREDRL